MIITVDKFNVKLCIDFGWKLALILLSIFLVIAIILIIVVAAYICSHNKGKNGGRKGANKNRNSEVEKSSLRHDNKRDEEN